MEAKSGADVAIQALRGYNQQPVVSGLNLDKSLDPLVVLIERVKETVNAQNRSAV